MANEHVGTQAGFELLLESDGLDASLAEIRGLIDELLQSSVQVPDRLVELLHRLLSRRGFSEFFELRTPSASSADRVVLCCSPTHRFHELVAALRALKGDRGQGGSPTPVGDTASVEESGIGCAAAGVADPFEPVRQRIWIKLGHPDHCMKCGLFLEEGTSALIHGDAGAPSIFCSDSCLKKAYQAEVEALLTPCPDCHGTGLMPIGGELYLRCRCVEVRA